MVESASPDARQDDARHYDALLPHLLETLRTAPDLALVRRSVEPRHARREARGIVLEASRYDLLSGAEPVLDLRVVRIAGPAVDVLNVMGFPADPSSTPIFAAELLGFGGVARIAFVDLQDGGLTPAARASAAAASGRALEAAAAALGDAHATEPRSGETREAPDWAMASSCGQAFFLRGDGARCHGAIHREIFRQYLAAWLEVRAEVGGQPGARSNDATTGLDNASRKGGHEERILQQYKRHHLANTPGSRFLSGLYSETWTSGFLSGFLYR